MTIKGVAVSIQRHPRGVTLPVLVTKARGPHELGEFHSFITVHPSYLLRIPDKAAKEAAYRDFVTDLRTARKLSA